VLTLTTTAPDRNRFNASRDRTGAARGIIGTGDEPGQGGIRTQRGITPSWTSSPPPHEGRAARHRFLFVPPGRLGWTFCSHRALITPCGEPPPDPEITRQQAAARLAATTSWQIISTGLATLAGCEHAINPAADPG
jgi:hypothetical protein